MTTNYCAYCNEKAEFWTCCGAYALLVIMAVCGIGSLGGCAGVAVQQFEADWKVGIDQEVKNVCADEEWLSPCVELNFRIGAAIRKTCATKRNDAACQQVVRDMNRDKFWEDMKETCAREAPTSCMLGKEYVISGYSDEWLNKQISIGGKRGDVAIQVKNRKAAERLRAETQDNRNASLGLLIGLMAAAAATPVYYPAPVLPYLQPEINCTSYTYYGTTRTSCY